MYQPQNFDNPPAPSENDIAIIGMACRFAGARNLQEYWANLRHGIESIERFDPKQLQAAGVPRQMFEKPNYLPMGAPLPDMECFDHALFGLSPRDAAIMDPQHRHFLQCAWQALEDAGHVADNFPGAISVFAGSGHNAYMPYNLLTNAELVEQIGFFLLRHTGNDKDFLATRASYLLNLTGPSVNVQTACSTSLVAVHMAVQSLLNGESDMALAGGVTIELPHRQGYLYEPGEILSPDGRCKAFDASAAGTVFGSGVGVVALRRLQDALDDGDHVYAVIKGSAVNNDGVGKVSYLAPSVDGQARAIAEALSVADIDPRSIGYVETHGTGTPVGDPIEIAALTQAFGQNGDARGYCAIGSVKPNIGHTDTAAGVAGLIKAAMALHQGEIPPSLHFENGNPACDFERTPFFVNGQLRNWPRQRAAPRRAGVSSLGVGGTNAHAILEEAPEATPSAPARAHQILTVSAASESALEANCAALASHLEKATDKLADIAFTLHHGRKALRYRRSIAATTHAEAAQALSAPPAVRGATMASERKPVFLFAGAGVQYAGMARGLYAAEKVFRAAVDECLDLMPATARADVRMVLFPESGADEQAATLLERPSIALPALFTVQYAMARLWMAWGVTPGAMIGHSMGQYTAAHLAGVFDLRDALKLVAGRGQLFETSPRGAMTSVMASEDALRPFIGAELSIAAVNGAEMTVISGSEQAIATLETELAAREISAQRIPVAVAAHSHLQDGILPAFRELLKTVTFRAPSRAFISNISGDWITAQEACDPEYWVRHLRETVRFHDGLRTVLGDEEAALIEVGPGRSLQSLARLHPDRHADQPIFGSLPHRDDAAGDVAHAADMLGRIWAAGLPVDWAAYHDGEKRRRVSLPGYCFDLHRHWIEPGKQTAQTRQPPTDPVGGLHCYAPSWERAALAPSSGNEARSALIFLDRLGVGERIAIGLRQRGITVSTVKPGARFGQRGSDFQMRARSAEDYATLLAAMPSPPDHVFHLWSLDGGRNRKAAANLDHGFYSLLNLARALGDGDPEHEVRIAVVTDGMQRIASEPVYASTKATILGPASVIPAEMANVDVTSIDVDWPQDRDVLARRLLAEMEGAAQGAPVALRGPERWVRRFTPHSLPTERSVSLDEQGLRPGGAYLITGGLGGIGLSLAEHLVQHWGARIALIARTALPDRATWPRLLAELLPDDPMAVRIRRLTALEAMGADILILNTNLTDASALDRAVREARKRFGKIDGVFHTAGVLDDGPIQLKTDAAAATVLAPKVDGTLNLLEALRRETPDFIFLFSSISAFAGIGGQADYAAANAFLDAVAQSHCHRTGTRTIAVNWPRWREIGMAATIQPGCGAIATGKGEQACDNPHPVLNRVWSGGSREQVFAARMSPDRDWLLAEHRLASGAALIPGTGYLELVRAAMRGLCNAEGIEMRDIAFLAPFAVEDGRERDLRVHLIQQGGGMWQFAIIGRATEAEPGQGWATHVRGFAEVQDGAIAPVHDMAELRRQCPDMVRPPEAQPHLRFGPRWDTVRQINRNGQSALIELQLPTEMEHDLAHFMLHPALMDFATAGAQWLMPGYRTETDFYAPASYGRVRIHAPLPARIFSHIRYRPDASTQGEMACFDVTIMDAHGQTLVEIERFTMLRVRDGMTLSADAPGGMAVDALSIATDDAMAMIETLTRADCGPQAIICPLPIDEQLSALRAPIAKAVASRATDAQCDDGPRTRTENLIAELWEKMLGVSHLSRSDNFFDLGGHSLLAVQMINKLRQQSGRDVLLTALIEAPTVSTLAALIAPEEQSEAFDSPDEIVPTMDGPRAVLLRPGGGKAPIFLVHDGLGEVLLYRSLALRLDEGHPVYGIAPVKSPDGAFAHTRIEDMARSYVAAVRAVQPEGPYALAGLCAGGVIAFEMACQLQHDGADIAFLGIVDAADVEASEVPFYIARTRLRRVGELFSAPEDKGIGALARTLGRKAYGAARYEIASRFDRRRQEHEVERLRQKTEPETAPLGFLQIYQVAHREYRPWALLADTRVTLFRAMQGTGPEEDIPFREKYTDCILGWGKRAAHDVELVEVPGGHSSALQEPNVDVLARAMQASIDAALGQSLPGSFLEEPTDARDADARLVHQ
ncbi:type I polyketide synthase [Sphingomonas sp. C3-2]|uniref:type I polyketide synthase n=1 Tax=Sphingomonas sp. C3-2 TaxID=3062169 RepID=UPI00294B61CD|nr:SDR family NAD(P)-dependent oxidoreductase [Sphingomonas sp. C3-2]WOK36595.1 SDR family NAD(P)-dependent oxidoreductase [Sphingomonas sp. C3-2]